MSLAQELSTTREAVRAAVPPHIFAAIGASIDDLKASHLAERAAGVGDRVSLPTLETIDGLSFDPKETAAERPLVLLFYRGGWCPYCNVTLRAYARALPAIQAAGGTLIAVTPESAGHAGATARDNDLTFPVAVDRDNVFARSLGLVFTLPDAMVPLYRELGIDVAAHNGGGGHDLPIPAIYVLDPSGRIAWAHVDTDFTARADTDEVVSAVRRLSDRLARGAAAA